MCVCVFCIPNSKLITNDLNPNIECCSINTKSLFNRSKNSIKGGKFEFRLVDRILEHCGYRIVCVCVCKIDANNHLNR